MYRSGGLREGGGGNNWGGTIVRGTWERLKGDQRREVTLQTNGKALTTQGGTIKKRKTTYILI